MGHKASAPDLWSAGAWLSPVRSSTQQVVLISLCVKGESLSCHTGQQQVSWKLPSVTAHYLHHWHARRNLATEDKPMTRWHVQISISSHKGIDRSDGLTRPISKAEIIDEVPSWRNWIVNKIMKASQARIWKGRGPQLRSARPRSHTLQQEWKVTVSSLWTLRCSVT